MEQSFTAAPGEQDVRHTVARILATAGFMRSKRLSELLCYLVEEALAGRGDRIKATTVAMDIYGRSEEFDQQSDPIVRVEAGRLRQRLNDYYREDGQGDAIFIEIPKVTYRPRFSVRDTKTSTETQAPPTLEHRPRYFTDSRRLTFVVFAMALAGLLLYVLPDHNDVTPGTSVRSAMDRPFIMVMPFEYRAEEPTYQGLSLGLVESLTTTLSKVSGLSVMAPTSIEEAGDNLSGGEISTLAERYGVTHLTRGSITTNSEQLIINIQLVDALNSEILWADRISHGADSVFNLEEDLSLRIANELSVQIQPDEREKIADLHTDSPEAWVLYRQGLVTVMPPNDLRRMEAARSLFRRARELDPTFAGSYAGESFSHTAMELFLATNSQEEELTTATALAERAIALDVRFGVAYAMLSFAQLMGDHLEPSVANARKAVDIQPGEAFSQFILGMNLTIAQRYEEAINALQEAVRLDPLEPRTPYLNQLAIMQYVAGRYSETVETIEFNLERGGPSGPHMQLFLSAALGKQGKTSEAQAVIKRMSETYPTFPYLGWLERWITLKPMKQNTIELLGELGLQLIYPDT